MFSFNQHACMELNFKLSQKADYHRIPQLLRNLTGVACSQRKTNQLLNQMDITLNGHKDVVRT